MSALYDWALQLVMVGPFQQTASGLMVKWSEWFLGWMHRRDRRRPGTAVAEIWAAEDKRLVEAVSQMPIT